MMENIAENPDYAFLVGKVRVLESRLIHPGVFYQLAELKSVEEIISHLSPYYPLPKEGRMKEWEEILEEAYFSIFQELSSLSPDEELFLPFWWRWELINLNNLLDEFLGKRSISWKREYLLPLSLYERAGKEKNFRLLPLPYSLWLKTALEMEKEGEGKGRKYLEEVYFKESLSISNSFPLLKKYLEQEIDFYNLKCFLRGLEKEFLKGGKISVQDWKEVKEKGWNYLINLLKRSDYETLAEEGLPAYKKNEVWRLEINLWKERFSLFSHTLYSPFIPETSLFYLLRKENEIRNLRWLLMGKVSGLPSKEIKERLGPFYVL
ncbi:MAG TPA: hypothetical protein ENG13_04810 [bacterium]|nr:hypothetical protein [bacterium]HEX68366.1 hypothetical protein [bacterium]